MSLLLTFSTPRSARQCRADHLRAAASHVRGIASDGLDAVRIDPTDVEIDYAHSTALKSSWCRLTTRDGEKSGLHLHPDGTVTTIGAVSDTMAERRLVLSVIGAVAWSDAARVAITNARNAARRNGDAATQRDADRAINAIATAVQIATTAPETLPPAASETPAAPEAPIDVVVAVADVLSILGAPLSTETPSPLPTETPAASVSDAIAA